MVKAAKTTGDSIVSAGLDATRKAGAVSGGFTGLMDYLNNPEKPKEDYSNNESNTYGKE